VVSLIRETWGLPPRNELFGAVVLVGFANGVAELIFQKIAQNGPIEAFFEAFGISAIVWISAFVALNFVLRSASEPCSRLDFAVCILSLVFFVIPSSRFSWVTLTGFSFYAFSFCNDVSLRKGAIIGAAIAFPMFWSKLLFSIFANAILTVDAMLVAAVLGFRQVGNTIELPDGGGELWIASGCSSLANVSLAVLCWATLIQLHDTPRGPRTLFICLLACISVVMINVGRISLIGLKPDLYDTIHGTFGTFVASWLTAAAIFIICVIGLRHEVASR
jgi:hypothetical protein